jgi:hypothetical protein
MAAQSKLEALAQEHGKSPMEFVVSEFYRHGSQAAMAKALKVSASTIRYWMMSLGISEKNVLVLDNSGYQLSPRGKQMIRKAE